MYIVERQRPDLSWERIGPTSDPHEWARLLGRKQDEIAGIPYRVRLGDQTSLEMKISENNTEVAKDE